MPIGHVDEEDPAPREVGDQEPAEHRPHGGGHGGPEGEDAGRPHPLGRREDPVEHGHADRGHHAAARTLNDPEDDELRVVLGQAAERRAHREDDDGGEQDALAAESVAQPARRRDEDGQAHQVGDDDAVDGRGRDVEVAADGGQRDVHDGDVHDVHEHGGDEHDADDDLLIHAGDSHVLFRFFGLAGEAQRSTREHRARPPGCAHDPMRARRRGSDGAGPARPYSEAPRVGAAMRARAPTNAQGGVPRHRGGGCRARRVPACRRGGLPPAPGGDRTRSGCAAPSRLLIRARRAGPPPR